MHCLTILTSLIPAQDFFDVSNVCGLKKKRGYFKAVPPLGICWDHTLY